MSEVVLGHACPGECRTVRQSAQRGCGQLRINMVRDPSATGMLFAGILPPACNVNTRSVRLRCGHVCSQDTGVLGLHAAPLQRVSVCHSHAGLLQWHYRARDHQVPQGWSLSETGPFFSRSHRASPQPLKICSQRALPHCQVTAELLLTGSPLG